MENLNMYLTNKDIARQSTIAQYYFHDNRTPPAMYCVNKQFHRSKSVIRRPSARSIQQSLRNKIANRDVKVG